jgi:hypothetical protein
MLLQVAQAGQLVAIIIFNPELTIVSRPSLSDERPSGPSKLRRISFQSRQRSQPSIPSSSSEPSDAFDQLLAVLAELVHDDGRHTINGFRPSRPPNALQAALIKLAEYLINKYGNDPAALMRIGLSMIPAFYSFPASMHPLLLMFFTRSVLGRVAGFVEQERPRTDVTKESSRSFLYSFRLLLFADSDRPGRNVIGRLQQR